MPGSVPLTWFVIVPKEIEKGSEIVGPVASVRAPAIQSFDSSQ